MQERNPFVSGDANVELPVHKKKEWREAVERITPDTYLPILKGKGTEHLVSEFNLPNLNVAGRGVSKEERRPTPRNVVGKVNYFHSLPLLKAHFVSPIEEKKAREKMEEDLNERRAQLLAMRAHFGHDAVPVPKFFIQDVPLTREVVDALYPNLVSATLEIPGTIPAIVSVQKRLEFDPKKTVDLTAQTPEMTLRSAEDLQGAIHIYATGQDILTGRSDHGLAEEDQRQAILDFYPDLHDVAKRMDDDPEFKRKLRDTVEKMITYTKETGVALDLLGRGNVVLMKGKKGWGLKMPDPLLLEDVRMHDLEWAAEKLSHGKPLDPYTAWQATVAMQSMRVINALALLSGVADRVEVPHVKDVPPDIWHKTLRAF